MACLEFGYLAEYLVVKFVRVTGIVKSYDYVVHLINQRLTTVLLHIQLYKDPAIDQRPFHIVKHYLPRIMKILNIPAAERSG